MTRAILILSALALTAWLAMSLPPATPPPVVPATAPDTEFSAERAREHLREITRAPRPLGSPGHAATRDYLIDTLRGLGLEPQIQQTTVTQQFPHTVSAVEVENIVARLRGTDSSGAVVLMSHYDSVTNSPGATDAGNGVAAILETVRALRAGPAPRNDVIVLITDAEEIGLMGARAYVDEHPWAADTGIVLNAEGRGHTGPVVMFRTAGQNGRMIRTLARTVPRALADSLASEAFRYMPNNTDLSIFDQAGYAGMDFANAHGITHYHYPLDSFDAANPRSLQHHGNYMLPLARAFGDQDLSALAAPRRVYFSLPAAGVIHYPGAWALPLAVLAVLAVIAVLAMEARRGRLRAGGAAWGGLYFVAALIFVPLIVWAAWAAVRGGIPEVEMFWHGTPYNDGYYLLALSLLAIAAYLALIAWAGRRLKAAELLAAPLCVWALLSVAVALWLPGASYLALWPLLFALAGLALAGMAGEDRPRVHDAILVLTAVPILLLLAPMIEGAAVMLTFDLLVVALVMLVLALGLLALQADCIARALSWRLPVLVVVAAAGMLAFGVFTAGFDEQRKKPNGVNYIADAGAGEAWWYSRDAETDEWTRLYLGDDPQRAPMPEWAPEQPFGDPRTPWGREAPLLRTDAPDATVLADETGPEGRLLRLRLDIPREAFVTVIRVPEAARARLLSVNGREAPDGPGQNEDLQIYYYGWNPAGVEIELVLPPETAAEMYLRSNIPGLPALDDGVDRSRPAHMMAAGPNADLTQLQRTVALSTGE